MTDEEYEALKRYAAERKLLRPEERGTYFTPDEANASWGGATWWTMNVLSQDHPLFIVVGALALIVQSIRFGMNLFF